LSEHESNFQAKILENEQEYSNKLEELKDMFASNKTETEKT